MVTIAIVISVFSFSLAHGCNIPRVPWDEGIWKSSNISLPMEPIIFTRESDSLLRHPLSTLIHQTERDTFLHAHGREHVTLAASNRYSKIKVSWSLEDYVKHFEEKEEGEGNEREADVEGSTSIKSPRVLPR